MYLFSLEFGSSDSELIQTVRNNNSTDVTGNRRGKIPPEDGVNTHPEDVIIHLGVVLCTSKGCEYPSSRV